MIFSSQITYSSLWFQYLPMVIYSIFTFLKAVFAASALMNRIDMDFNGKFDILTHRNRR